MLKILKLVFIVFIIVLPIWILINYSYSFIKYTKLAIAANKADVEIFDVVSGKSTVLSHWLLVDGHFSIITKDDVRHTHKSDLTKIKKLFPNKDDYKKIIRWGNKLVMSSNQTVVTNSEKAVTIGIGNLKVHGYEQYLSSKEIKVTEKLAAHAVWQRLTSSLGENKNDLFDIEKIVRKEVNDPLLLEKLRKWAAFRRTQKETTIYFDHDDEFKHSLTVRPNPPDIDWIQWWIIYEDWCPTESLLDRRKEYLHHVFGGNEMLGVKVWDALMNIGKQTYDQLNKNKMSLLPNNNERTYLIHAIDRLSGLDPIIIDKTKNISFENLWEYNDTKKGTHSDSKENSSLSNTMAYLERRFLSSEDIVSGKLDEGEKVLDKLKYPVGFYQPNDKVYMYNNFVKYIFSEPANWPFTPYNIAAYNGTGDVHPYYSLNSHWTSRSEHWGFRAVSYTLNGLFLIITIVVMRIFFSLLTYLMMVFAKTWNEEEVEFYIDSMKNGTAWFLNVILTILFSCLIYIVSRYFLPIDPYMVLFSRSEEFYIFTTIYITIMGGIVMEATSNLITEISILLGLNPSKYIIWFDDIIAISFVSYLLFIFGNSIDTIIFAVLIGFVRPFFIGKIQIKYFSGERSPIVEERRVASGHSSQLK